MELEKKLIASIEGYDSIVKNICIGITWTAIESRFAGLSHTYQTSEKTDIANAGELTSFTGAELAKRILSWKPLEASIGVAAINSLVEPSGEKGNVKDFIMDKVRGKVVTMVGRFPFYNEIAAIARKLYLLEINPIGEELPAFACEEVIPKSDMNLITGTALINHSLQRLLELGQNGYNIVLGPTTPLSPVLFDFGADIVAGAKVTDYKAASKSIMQGVRRAKKLQGVEPLCLFRKGIKI
jgi:uncharacterized protein (DUF4213/DUF364 family)